MIRQEVEVSKWRRNPLARVLGWPGGSPGFPSLPWTRMGAAIEADRSPSCRRAARLSEHKPRLAASRIRRADPDPGPWPGGICKPRVRSTPNGSDHGKASPAGTSARWRPSRHCLGYPPRGTHAWRHSKSPEETRWMRRSSVGPKQQGSDGIAAARGPKAQNPGRRETMGSARAVVAPGGT